MSDPVSMEVHNEAMRRLDAENHRQNERISILENTVREIQELTATVKELATNMSNMYKEQEKQGARLESLEKHDGDMWRTVVKYIITLIVGAVTAFLFTKIGL